MCFNRNSDRFLNKSPIPPHEKCFSCLNTYGWTGSDFREIFLSKIILKIEIFATNMTIFHPKMGEIVQISVNFSGISVKFLLLMGNY